MSRNSLLKTGAESEVEVTAVGIEWIQVCGFTLKRLRDMIRTYNQMLHTDKYSQHSSIIWPAWLNG